MSDPISNSLEATALAGAAIGMAIFSVLIKKGVLTAGEGHDVITIAEATTLLQTGPVQKELVRTFNAIRAELPAR